MVISRWYFSLYYAVTMRQKALIFGIFINVLHKIHYRQEQEFSKAVDWPKLPPSHEPFKELLKNHSQRVWFCFAPSAGRSRDLLGCAGGVSWKRYWSESQRWPRWLPGFGNRVSCTAKGCSFWSPCVTWRQPQAFPPCGWFTCLWFPVSTVMHPCGY